MLSSIPYTFTHRDFHSKNLMCLPGGEVGILDFQVALLGPYIYDLVSLTCDAYVDVPEELEDELKTLYKKRMGGIIPQDFTDFETHYSMCAVQRTFKAAGRFLYIYREKKNKKFLPYVIQKKKKGIKHSEKLGLKSTEKIKDRIPKVEELIRRAISQ